GTYAGNILASNAVAGGGTGFLASNYSSVTYNPGTLTITPSTSPVVITADNQSTQYGTTVSLTGAPSQFSVSGLVAGNQIGSVTLTSTDNVVGTNAGTYAGNILASNAVAGGGTGFLASNYSSVTYNPGTLTITPSTSPVVITADNQSTQYGTTVSLTGAPSQFSVTGLVAGNQIGSVTLTSTDNVVGTNAGTYAGNIVASNAVGGGGTGFLASNYSSVTYVNGSLRVTPAPLTITADNETKPLGTTFTFTGTEYAASGLVNGDAITSVNLSSAGSSALATAGNYSINVAGAVGTKGTNLANYAITYQSGTMIIPSAGPTCTPQCTDLNISQAASALNSVLDVQFINPTAGGNACDQLPIDDKRNTYDDGNNPCIDNLIAVLPEANGHVGAVVVHGPNGTTLLNKAYAGVGSAAGSADFRPVTINAAEVSSLFAPTLQALPRVFVIYFRKDSTEMLPQSQLDFDRAVGDIKQRGAAQIVITGHTDTLGSEGYDNALALHRAQHVQEMMVKRGVPAAWTKTAGEGKRDLAVPTRDQVNEQLNRRVVIDAQ
ncbi:MAG TPA: MBG domain-containing protein, partial [Stellaceae bacterium]|nr:MBG domain-containing protein [Stellaceae bacterium]